MLVTTVGGEIYQMYGIVYTCGHIETWARTIGISHPWPAIIPTLQQGLGRCARCRGLKHRCWVDAPIAWRSS